ncbi:hypothetical protein M9458_024148, partial [Cirrhinus mrigala]
VTVLKKMCCSDLEALFIDCKPFYSPREFCSFILVSVYIPPQANVSLALQKLADQIADTEQKHPDSVLIILGDFNKANLSRELPKYSQHVTCPTRDSNILDHCYTVIKDAYRSVPRAALGLSDHCLVHLIPTYRQKLKSAKPVVKTVKRWTNETERVLQACFEWTDWSVFEAAANDLDEPTETVTSYISFCEDICIPTRTYLTFNNDKPWFTAKLRHLRQAKEDAYRKGDRVLYNQARNTLNKEIRAAKRTYAKRLEDQFASNDPTSVWKGLKAITNYKTPSPSTEVNQQLAEDLNEFYCRFKIPHTRSDHLLTQPLTPPTNPSSPPPALQISEEDVCQVFRKNKRRKAPGPDGVTPACLKTCADQLAPIFSQIFNRSLELCKFHHASNAPPSSPSQRNPKLLDLTTTDLWRSRLDGEESAYRQEVEQLAVWCSLNNLELNTLKTVEMVIDFRRNPPALPPLSIMDSTVAAVETFKFLGSIISRDLKWDTHIDSITKKAQQRLYFLRQLKKFNLPQELLKQFYSAVIESVLCTSITVWFGSATKSDTRRLQRTVRTAERIISASQPTLQELYTS